MIRLIIHLVNETVDRATGCDYRCQVELVVTSGSGACMRSSRRTNTGSTIARRWRPWLWANDEQPHGDLGASPVAPPTPVRHEIKAVDAREPVRNTDEPTSLDTR